MPFVTTESSSSDGARQLDPPVRIDFPHDDLAVRAACDQVPTRPIEGNGDVSWSGKWVPRRRPVATSHSSTLPDPPVARTVPASPKLTDSTRPNGLARETRTRPVARSTMTAPLAVATATVRPSGLSVRAVAGAPSCVGCPIGWPCAVQATSVPSAATATNLSPVAVNASAAVAAGSE